jgi:hypothetical protein
MLLDRKKKRIGGGDKGLVGNAVAQGLGKSTQNRGRRGKKNYVTWRIKQKYPGGWEYFESSYILGESINIIAGFPIKSIINYSTNLFSILSRDIH